jgi:hypothetical protein
LSDLRFIDVFPSTEFCKGYAAGFFDGEGSVGLYIYKNRPKPVISITNCHWHVLNYLQTLVLPLLEVDFHGQKQMQIRISAWKDIQNFVEVFKEICIVKREQLELMNEAIELHEIARKRRKGKNVYSERNIEEFKRICYKLKKAKKKIKNYYVRMEKAKIK